MNSTGHILIRYGLLNVVSNVLIEDRRRVKIFWNLLDIEAFYAYWHLHFNKFDIQTDDLDGIKRSLSRV